MGAYVGLIGIVVILAAAFAMSNNRAAIDRRLVICGLCLQLILALFILRTAWGQELFQLLGSGVEKLLEFADHGTSFVLGPLNDKEKMTTLFGPSGGFIFAFKLIPTLIFVSALSALAYHLGVMQKVVGSVAWVIYRIMGASGSEATSNSASVLVGMLEAPLLIKPFLAQATRSELQAILAGSMACISGGLMAVYVQMGIAVEFMMAASVMAIPGALVISKIICPETETSMTKAGLNLEIERTSVNSLDAVAVGAVDGLKVGVCASAVLIAVLALIALLDSLIANTGLLLADWLFAEQEAALLWALDLNHLSLGSVLGAAFYYPALLMGVPAADASTVGGLMGTKLVVNEFVAYSQMAPLVAAGELAAQSELIATFALCGFANFGSVAILIGGVGGMVPERKHDLSQVGLPAMICGTLASYLSASLVGVIQASSGDANRLVPLGLIAVAAAIIVYFNRKAART